MPPDTRVRAWLWDIEAAADAIDRFIGDLGGAAYERSELVTAAVERKFEIIGEALSQMLKRLRRPPNGFPTSSRLSRSETC